jgi:hypothetical protein
MAQVAMHHRFIFIEVTSRLLREIVDEILEGKGLHSWIKKRQDVSQNWEEGELRHRRNVVYVDQDLGWDEGFRYHSGQQGQCWRTSLREGRVGTLLARGDS